MKIRVYKHQMERWVQFDELEQFESAGWSQHPPSTVKQLDEQIVLKAPAKSKSAAKSLDNANKGDE